VAFNAGKYPAIAPEITNNINVTIEVYELKTKSFTRSYSGNIVFMMKLMIISIPNEVIIPRTPADTVITIDSKITKERISLDFAPNAFLIQLLVKYIDQKTKRRLSYL